MTRKARDLVLALLHYLRSRVGEPSTWRGLVWLATGGMTQLKVDDPASIENVASLGMIVAGLLGVLLPDEKKKDGQA
jgi:hypothetical protein